jgi:hypothetical protein
VSERLRPKDRWARTVLSDDAKVTKLVDRSRTRLEELPRLRTSLRNAIDHGEWFVVCCTCSLIGELIFASLDPTHKADKFPRLSDLRIPAKKAKARHKELGQKRNTTYLFLAALRHTCFHPAMAEPIRDLPRDLFPKMSNLHMADAADWALEQLDAALRFELGF